MMKKVFNLIKKSLSACVICAFLGGYALPVFAADYRLTISDTEVRSVDEGLYGMGSSFSSMTDFVTYNEETDSYDVNTAATEQFADKYKIPHSRMMGTQSRYFKWKKSIGPMAERKYTGFGTLYKETAGIVEWIKVTRAMNPDATFTFCLNLETDTAANAADLAEFLTGDGNTNPNGGTNWAQLRKSYGIENPVSVIWELGNETDQDFEHRFSYFTNPHDYVKVAKKYIHAIRKVDPDAVFAAHAATGGIGEMEYRNNWTPVVLEKLQDDIDYLVLHSYPGTSNIDDVWTTGINKLLRYMKTNLKEENKDRIKLYFTEYSVYVPSEEEYYINGYSLHGALVVSEMLNRMQQIPEVARADYYCFMNKNVRGAYYLDPDGNYQPSTMGLLHDMYADYGVGTVLQSTLYYKYPYTQSWSPTNSSGLSYSVVKSGDKYHVFFVNQTGTDHTLFFQNGSSTLYLKEKRMMSGETSTDHNGYAGGIEKTEGFNYEEATGLNRQVNNSANAIVVPKYSVSVFVLKKQ